MTDERTGAVRTLTAWIAAIVPQASARNGATAAQKVQALLIDDLDGSAAGGTVRFGLDGTEYEIDLNDGHARDPRDTLARYAKAARSGPRARRAGRTPPRSAGPRPRASR